MRKRNWLKSIFGFFGELFAELVGNILAFLLFFIIGIGIVALFGKLDLLGQESSEFFVTIGAFAIGILIGIPLLFIYFAKKK